MDVVMQWNERGQVRGLRGEGAECERADGILYLAGSGTTDGGGSWSLDVRKALCPEVELGVPTWISLVATPSTRLEEEASASRAASTSVTTAWRASGGGATLFVRSWSCGCDPAGGVDFSFHAAVSYVFVT